MFGAENDWWAGDGSPMSAESVERRRIAEQTLEPASSVAHSALKYGVNANQGSNGDACVATASGCASDERDEAVPISMVEYRETPKVDVEELLMSRAAIQVELRGLGGDVERRAPR
jgi:hypothetical protein